jgi:hypothetical protein
VVARRIDARRRVRIGCRPERVFAKTLRIRKRMFGELQPFTGRRRQMRQPVEVRHHQRDRRDAHSQPSRRGIELAVYTLEHVGIEQPPVADTGRRQSARLRRF